MSDLRQAVELLRQMTYHNTKGMVGVVQMIHMRRDAMALLARIDKADEHPAEKGKAKS
jgi:hypothetical protein